jgi:DNA-binding response OmpR family regulator
LTAVTIRADRHGSHAERRNGNTNTPVAGAVRNVCNRCAGSRNLSYSNRGGSAGITPSTNGRITSRPSLILPDRPGPVGSGGRGLGPRLDSRVPYPVVVGEDRLLIIEDDDTIATNLVRAFSSVGYVSALAATGTDALHHLERNRVDLVLLDLGLPDMDGVDVCREIRSRDAVLPIIMLTARQEEIDIVVGLDAGAVDYITKPFRLAELLARVRAQLRRLGPPDTGDLSVGPLRIDLAARRAWLGDSELDLRAKEFDLLLRLVRDAGRVVTREDLMSDVWDENWFGSTKTLDVHIASLRRKLGDEASGISTLRGVGYRYDLP